MKKFRSTLILFFTLIITFSTPINTFANTSKENYEKSAEMATYFGEVMYVLLENYYYQDVTAEELYEAAMEGLFSQLDEHSSFFTRSNYKQFLSYAYGIKERIGIVVEEKDGNILITSLETGLPAEKIGIKAGDILISVNDVVFDGIDSFYSYFDTLNGDINIKVKRGQEELAFVIQKEKVTDPTVFGLTMPEAAPTITDGWDYRYVAISGMDENTDEEMKTLIEKYKGDKVKGIILDLRGNSGGSVDSTFEICDLIVPEGDIGYFVNSYGEKEYIKSSLKTPPFEKIVVLTDEYTASAAEFLAFALKQSGSIVVGEKTYGKAVGQSILEGPLEETAFRFTTIEFIGTDGTKIQGQGLEPNVEVETINGIDSLENIDINHIKNILTTLGYETGEPSDVFDDKTKEALLKFQKDNELPETGYIDKKTAVQINLNLSMSLYQNDPALIKAYEIIIGD